MADITTTNEISQQILDALDGRTQSWLVDKVKDYTNSLDESEEKKVLSTLTDVYLSRKMNKKMDWNDCEIKAISKILKVKFKI